ncbi:MAG: flagellar biosynthetic protein FliO [Lachnospiraceae bacterium]|nr:flagellar biosynthetic protein FliO [Lachnospiraceae bacterium]MCI7594710.1 flagellar biosynthetic protein FliO [Lachnospiraceae bacterium]MDD7049536.1 flagellar biosynthetic protein FliO [Lachnospiraceae bacterium]MDY3221723.1 flagellar biosynthetic protein FliO [Lachnospiraceae bacterium]MDY4096719.1 flagellar biosynthetic protein FliO [Lachnospiraceae bacterium]
MLLSLGDPVSSSAQFITVLLIFLFVVAITYFTTRYIAGYQKNLIRTGNMELVESLRISNNKYLQIVKTGNKYLVIAVCKDTVTFLTELEESELIISQEEAVGLDFKGLLEKAKQLRPGSGNQDIDKGK